MYGPGKGRGGEKGKGVEEKRGDKKRSEGEEEKRRRMWGEEVSNGCRGAPDHAATERLDV